jgi:hypothetical protein
VPLALASAAFLGSESLVTRDHIFTVSETSLFVASYDSQGHGGGIRHVRDKVTLRPTVSQSVSLGVEPHLGLMTRYLLLFDSYGLVFFLWGALSDERTGLSFVYATGPCQRSLSQVRVPWNSRPYFTVSELLFFIYLFYLILVGRY